MNRPWKGSSTLFRCPVDLHRPREEARIEQMQDRMLDAADILVDRQPALRPVDIGKVGGLRLVPRIGEAREIPRGVHERVHRVGIAPRILPAVRAGDVLPRRVVVERVARPVERHVIGQPHRQLVGGDRHRAAIVAVDHRDRASPVALPRDQPVAQAELHLSARLRPAADGHAGKALGHFVERCRGFMPSRKRELIITPSSVKASSMIWNVAASASSGITTGTTGRPYLLAKSRSR